VFACRYEVSSASERNAGPGQERSQVYGDALYHSRI
jgi:hypothetical protein